jgi:nidogen-like
MKKARAVLTSVIFFLSVVSLVHGQKNAPLGQPVQSARANDLTAYGSNTIWLQLTGFTNNTAFLVINVPGTATNNVYNLFFNTNNDPPCPWRRVMRCEPGQTNPVVTNLPPTHGFFMLDSPIRLGFDQQSLAANDDGSTLLVPLSFTINFLSNSESALYVNNNGNVTFDGSLGSYTPSPLANVKMKIIAPFWADVDTRNPASAVVQYGTNVVHGRNAFGADWVNVGYYADHADALLSCQLVIIDRSDIAPGDFDMEFNYNRVEWQWGDVSVGDPPRAGFSDGFTDIELSGSGVNGAFMDTNTVTGLVYNSLNTPILGRYLFFFRNGQPLP